MPYPKHCSSKHLFQDSKVQKPARVIHVFHSFEGQLVQWPFQHLSSSTLYQPWLDYMVKCCRIFCFMRLLFIFLILLASFLLLLLFQSPQHHRNCCAQTNASCLVFLGSFFSNDLGISSCLLLFLNIAFTFRFNFFWLLCSHHHFLDPCFKLHHKNTSSIFCLMSTSPLSFL